MSKSNVLSIQMRPTSLSTVIGQDICIKGIREQFKSGRTPHFFLITGSTGTGKTTLARIIANILQTGDLESDYMSHRIYTKFDTKEINASDKNGVDDIREEIEGLKYKPQKPSLAKVIIWDEAHQITTAAQNALLKVTEDSPEHAYIIFCTNNEGKIIPTLKRRAYTINTQGLTESNIKLLLNRTRCIMWGFDTNCTEEYLEENTVKTKELLQELVNREIDSPGLILQAAEKYFTGTDVKNCVTTSSTTGLDTRALSNSLSKGSWSGCKSVLKEAKKEDVVTIRLMALGYLKVVLLNGNDAQSLKIAKAIDQINSGYKYDDDLPSLIASIRIACDIISG